MRAQFTPGPWAEIEAPDDWSVGHDDAPVLTSGAIAAGDKVVAFVVQIDRRWVNSTPELDANARLIAAAPDLYEALRLFLEDERFQVAVGGNPNAVEAMLAQARAALSRARDGSAA